MRRSLVAFSQRTSAHGIPLIGGSRNMCMRIFWSVVFLCCLTTFSVQLYLLISQFLQFTKSSKSEMKFSAMDFPAVTFCNLNPLVLGRALEVPDIRDLNAAYEKSLKPLAARRKRDTDLTSSKRGSSINHNSSNHSSRKRETGAFNELVLVQCAFDPEVTYYMPTVNSEVTPDSAVCVCVNDVWDLVSYCSPAQYWVLQQCDVTDCSEDNFCGPLDKSLELNRSTDNFILCMCNSLLDGCYNDTTIKADAIEPIKQLAKVAGAPLLHDYPNERMLHLLNALDTSGNEDATQLVESRLLELRNVTTVQPETTSQILDELATSKSTVPMDTKGRKRVDPATLRDQQRSTLSQTTPDQTVPTLDLSGSVAQTAEDMLKDADPSKFEFLFRGLTDEFAIQSKAREGLMAISATLEPPIREGISTSLVEFIRLCSYAGGDCDLARDFKITPDPAFGNCYTFNHNASKKKPPRAGSNYGLRVLLYTAQQDYMFTSDSAGIRMQVHEQRATPFPDALGKSAPVGYIVSFGVRAKEIKRLGKPWGDCQSNWTEETIYPTGSGYTVEACRRSCQQRYVSKWCDCCDPRYPCPVNYAVCPSTDQDKLSCLKYSANTLNNQAELCKCKMECRQIAYTTTFSSSRWPVQNSKLTACHPMDNKTCIEAFSFEVSAMHTG